LSPLEVVHLAEQVTRKRFDVQHVPEEALRAQYDSATDPLQQSFAALMLSYAHGSAIDMTRTLQAFPGRHLRSVRQYFEASAVSRPGGITQIEPEGLRQILANDRTAVLIDVRAALKP